MQHGYQPDSTLTRSSDRSPTSACFAIAAISQTRKRVLRYDNWRQKSGHNKPYPDKEVLPADAADTHV